MRIGIDARELIGRPTGVGRYLRSLLDAWAGQTAGPHEFLLYVPSRERVHPGTLSSAPGVQVRMVGRAIGTVWEQHDLRRAADADGLDVFFAPAYTAPLALRTPFVVTVHDVSFAAHPEWFRWREGMRRRWLTAWSARRARLVLTDTEFSKGEISARLGVSRERVRVIPLGIDRQRVTERPREPLVLYVGTILNRRHVPELIEAFAEVARRRADVTLVIAGDNRTYPHEDLDLIAQRCGVAPRVAIRSYVAEDELRALYARASVFVFLSEYEGFGLPPLEALAAGVPPVVGDSPVAREVCGEAAVFVPIGDVGRTANALEELLHDEGARARVLAAGQIVLARYSWAEAARATLTAIEAGAAGVP